jgi:CHRD domain
MNGILSQGTITSANLEGPLKGKQVSDLISLISSGGAYANVHTKQNPKGEIRGQIS